MLKSWVMNLTMNISYTRLCELIRYAINDAKTQGRAGLVLTCKQKLIPYYARFGFVDEGVSDKSNHGNAVWHQMRLTF